MKFNPYPVLLTTAALMFATVVFAQTGHSAALVKAGAVSVDRGATYAPHGWGPQADPAPHH